MRQHLDANSWRLAAIYNTHSNADHIGGNRYLQNQTGCRVYAPGIECAFTRYPVLEPSFLYGGFPCSDLRHKFLMAQESDCAALTPEVLPDGFELIELPGHFFHMAGFRTPDGVVFLADCLSSRETLEKYQIGFIYDVAAYLETLRKLPELGAKMYVPAHAEATEDIAPLAELNIRHVESLCETVLGFCAEPRGFEEILKLSFDSCRLQLTLEQYVLVGSTVKSILAWLLDSGAVETVIESNRLLWRRK